MSKNILIFSDGTEQAGGLRPDQRLSNVYKLYRATRTGPESPINPAEQIAFYDPGLGTDTDGGRIPIRIWQVLRKFASAATGLGISTNIIDCYEAILKHYEPGDRIYLFGFSRGAYTARCVAGVLGLCGVPTRASGSPIPRFGRGVRAIAEEAVLRVYEHGAGKRRAEYEAERKEQALRFREKYKCGEGNQIVAPYFIGVFDTVAALGVAGALRHVMRAALAMLWLAIASLGAAIAWYFGVPFLLGLGGFAFIEMLFAAWRFGKTRYRVIHDYPKPGQSRRHLAGWKATFYDGLLSTRVRFARHALAIDETRAAFDRVRWANKGLVVARPPGEPDWLRQVWFAGNHSDIGGSYPEEESRLSDIALKWMVEQASEIPHRLIVDWSKLNLFPAADGMQHCEVEALRERIPRWLPRRLREGWPVGLRKVHPEAPLHPTVLERFKLDAVRQLGESKQYRPEALRGHRDVSRYYE